MKRIIAEDILALLIIGSIALLTSFSYHLVNLTMLSKWRVASVIANTLPLFVYLTSTLTIPTDAGGNTTALSRKSPEMLDKTECWRRDALIFASAFIYVVYVVFCITMVFYWPVFHVGTGLIIIFLANLSTKTAKIDKEFFNPGSFLTEFNWLTPWVYLSRPIRKKIMEYNSFGMVVIGLILVVMGIFNSRSYNVFIIAFPVLLLSSFCYGMYLFLKELTKRKELTEELILRNTFTIAPDFIMVSVIFIYIMAMNLPPFSYNVGKRPAQFFLFILVIGFLAFLKIGFPGKKSTAKSSELIYYFKQYTAVLLLAGILLFNLFY
ncbi:MAG: hypothetical protein HYV28_10975 [Ignavibacteriales bacterium]|nr:hypothetical protein [Ignavibacteriales bacterium]